MSSAHLLKNNKEQKTDIVGLFEIYVKDRFDNWENYLKNQEFFELMTYMKPKYGQSIFYDMVNLVAKYEDVAVMDLLSGFGDFRNKYY